MKPPSPKLDALLIGTAIAGMVAMWAPTFGADMNTMHASNTQERAAAATGWKAEDIDLLDNGALNRAGCRFYNAVHKHQMDGVTVELAELPDGNVVASAPGHGGATAAAASILSQCGADAPADWWAEVVARFSGEARGRVVKSSDAAYDIGEIEKRGAKFHAPTLERDGTATRLSYYAIRYEPSQPFRVSAILSNPTTLSVTCEALGSR